MTTSRRLAVLTACLAISGGCLLASRAPLRFTWTNDGVAAAYPATTVALAFAAALALGAATAPATRRPVRVLLALAALWLGLRAADRAVYRLEARASGIDERSVLGTRSASWPELTSVASDASRILVRLKQGEPLEIAASRMRPEDRATLERTLARRVREAQTPQP